MKTITLLLCAWVLWSAAAEAQPSPDQRMETASCLRKEHAKVWMLSILSSHKKAVASLDKADLPKDEKNRLLSAYGTALEKHRKVGPPAWGTRVRLPEPTPPTPEELARQEKQIQELRELVQRGELAEAEALNLRQLFPDPERRRLVEEELRLKKLGVIPPADIGPLPPKYLEAAATKLCETRGKRDSSDATAQTPEALQRGCDRGVAAACAYLGFRYEIGDGVRQDNSKAVELYTKGCDGGDAGGCSNLGLMYAKGDGVRQDKSKAVELYTKACDGGAAQGCFNLGVSYAKGDGVRQDNFKAVELFTKACDGGEATGCSGLGAMYAKGDGVRQDNSKAVELFTKGCDGGNATGCSNLGAMYATGDGVRQSTSRAKELFGKACDLREEAGCKEYARLNKR